MLESMALCLLLLLLFMLDRSLTIGDHGLQGGLNGTGIAAFLAIPSCSFRIKWREKLTVSGFRSGQSRDVGVAWGNWFTFIGNWRCLMPMLDLM